ncbi:hypothetical protein [Streptomyces silvensis]|uniref:Uncharacterized protein n=1 Tax=Streptomyces silvensis TaxID=1765722 RepID=A0A0W7X3S8_9ACTN|nr:hypothetical protein [Streptomyces silvensis]KUF17532.1 hypothetical protein AT728_08880 [Streptomyces silvensis]
MPETPTPVTLTEDQLAALADAVAARLSVYLVRRDPVQVPLDDPVSEIGTEVVRTEDPEPPAPLGAAA